MCKECEHPLEEDFNVCFNCNWMDYEIICSNKVFGLLGSFAI